MNCIKNILILGSLFLGIIFGGCNLAYKSGFVPPPVQNISGPITIGPEWVEIVPPQPLKSYGSSQRIELDFKDYKDFSLVETDEEDVLDFSDGRRTKVESFIYDDQGQSYELGLWQSSSGPSLHRKGNIQIVDGVSDYSQFQLPSDRTFTKLKIRSVIDFKCEKIELVGSNPK